MVVEEIQTKELYFEIIFMRCIILTTQIKTYSCFVSACIKSL